MTSARSIAFATVGGGSAACGCALVHDGQNGIAPGLCGLLAHPLADRPRRRVADHENALAFAHAEALANDGADGAIEIVGHGANVSRRTAGYRWGRGKCVVTRPGGARSADGDYVLGEVGDHAARVVVPLPKFVKTRPLDPKP